MGATRRQIASVFVWEGVAIGVFGVVGGAALGLAICWTLAKYPVIELPEVFYDRSLPVLVQTPAVVGVVVTAMAIVIVGALMPARKASEITPMQGIRD
jgi:lipoprotein-releasing system permease protein